ncbi:MAG: hypothetical protein AVDCRST_MAG64-3632, partial [uncultured Phycisphaerae bacterium]
EAAIPHDHSARGQRLVRRVGGRGSRDDHDRPDGRRVPRKPAGVAVAHDRDLPGRGPGRTDARLHHGAGRDRRGRRAAAAQLSAAVRV